MGLFLLAGGCGMNSSCGCALAPTCSVLLTSGSSSAFAFGTAPMMNSLFSSARTSSISFSIGSLHLLSLSLLFQFRVKFDKHQIPHPIMQ